MQQKRLADQEKKRYKADGGYSLVEVIVAVAILVICVIPFLSSFALTAQTNAKARQMLNGTTVAENVMEDIKSKGVEHFGVKSGDTVSINSKLYDVYTADIPNYHYDGKNYQVSVEMVPSSGKYTDASALVPADKYYNEEKLSEIYQMKKETDAIYVQDKNTLYEQIDDYYKDHVFDSSVTPETIADDIRSEYTFKIKKASSFITVTEDVEFIYRDKNEALKATIDTNKIFDSLQTREDLRNLYIFFVPGKENVIHIENTSDIPLQVYLVKQNSATKEDVTLEVTESAHGGSALTKIATNLDITDAAHTEFTKLRVNNIDRTLTDAVSVLGMTGLVMEEDDNTKVYDVTISVKSQSGKELATITGSSLK